jgi:hypothetical protein
VTEPPVTEVGAVRFAEAVNLRANDLPEMSSGSTEAGESPPPTASALQFADCYRGVSPTLRKVKAHSPEFSTGHAAEGASVLSEVEVFPSEALAARNLTAYSSPRGLACIARAENVVHGRWPGRLRYGPVTITRLPMPLPGNARGFGLRVTAALNSSQRHLRVYKDIFGFLSGPAETELIASRFTHPHAGGNREAATWSAISSRGGKPGRALVAQRTSRPHTPRSSPARYPGIARIQGSCEPPAPWKSSPSCLTITGAFQAFVCAAAGRLLRG